MNSPYEALLSRLEGVRRTGSKATARCPAHNDRKASLSIAEGDDGRVLLKCFAGCTAEAIVMAIGLTMKDLFPDDIPPASLSVKGVSVLTSPGITLEELAEAKRLPVDFLASLAWKNVKRNGKSAVRIPYRNETGDVNTIRYRMALTGHRFEYRSGDHAMLYGLDRLAETKKAGWVLLVEGETDAATAWHYGLSCIGVPGKDMWRAEWATHLDGLDCYVWQEPKAESFSAKIGAAIPSLKVIIAPDGIKDISDAHVLGHKLPEFLAALRAKAIPYASIVSEQRTDALAALKQEATSVLATPDPLELVADAVRGLGYGGDIGPVLIVYLAATSRLLAMRPGAMPVHLLLVGPPSAGKSYTLNIVLRLLPAEAHHTIDAGSPRILIYDSSDLRHRLLVFSEADSLPAGEDNPCASAVRNLLQDHYLHYAATIRDPETGAFTVEEKNKPGPTVMISTAVRRLGAQLDSRLFSLEVPDGQQQMRSALLAQAQIELSGAAEAPEPLIAFQGYLQALAPWEVVVPFAGNLAEAIAASPVSARATRDYARLLSLIKATAVLRYMHRQRDAQGRLMASLEDYQTVYRLVGDMYAVSATGAGEKLREVVAAVQSLVTKGKMPITVSDVAREVGVNVMAASRRVNAALRGRWLVNCELRKRAPMNLSVGEPLPQKAGLPTPEELGVNPALTPLEPDLGDVNTLTPLTERNNAGVSQVADAVEV